MDGYFSLRWFEKGKEESVKVETVGNLYAVELEDAHLPVVFFSRNSRQKERSMQKVRQTIIIPMRASSKRQMILKGVFMVAMVLLTSGALAQQDDTFTGLRGVTPDIVIKGDQGYKTYTLVKWKAGTVIDAISAKWDSYMYCRNRETCNQEAKNNYPIQIGADWNGAPPSRISLYDRGTCPPPGPQLLWYGGVVNGTAPMGCTWHESKNSNGGGITLNALKSVVDGIRIHNTHDPIVPLEGGNFVYKNCWISYARDDAIENDAFANGLFEDCLFDGVYCFYSARNPRKPGRDPQAMAPTGGPNSVVKFHNCLIWLQNMPRPGWGGSNGYGHVWKQSDSRGPKIELVNNIFYIEKPADGCASNRYDVTPQGLVKSEGNTVIFLGDKYPFNPKGFKVINDNAEGKALWQKARQDWIERHPYVGRVDGDPPAKPFIQM